MSFKLDDFLQRNLWNVLIVLAFLAGQFYLIEYRLGETEDRLKSNAAQSRVMMDKMIQMADDNRQRIRALEVSGASDISELQTMVSNLKEQVGRLEYLTEQQHRLFSDRNEGP